MNYRFFSLLVCFVSIFAGAFAAPWDALRGPAQAISVIEPVIVWLMLIVSFVLFVIALLAVRKKFSTTLLWVGIAFGLFFIKSLLVVLDLYVSSGDFFNYSIQALFDLLIVGSLFVALFRK
ncbi:MAG: hypothetical protein NTY48_02570 [Candidatus Diapherotrites archaeon]|nr:hypothetical protein [Candidatus Diapherotrites archaeon]